MPQDIQLPVLNRITFYRLNEGELISALAQAITKHIGENSDEKLTANHAAVLAWARMSTDVPNGGFTQFFYNHRGDRGVEEVAILFESIEVPKASALLRDAVKVFRQHQRSFAVDNPWDGLFGSIREFDKLDKAFTNIILKCDRALEKWIRLQITELAVDESGEPIDP